MADPTFSLKIRSEKSKKHTLEKHWLILSGIFSVLIIFVLAPQFSTWKSLNKENETQKEKIEEIKADIDEKIKTKNAQEKKKRKLAGNEAATEDQVYPIKVDTQKIANILEIIAFQTEYNGFQRSAKLNLQNIRFSGSQKNNEAYYTKADISVDGDKASIQKFINFIKTGDSQAIIKKGIDEEVITSKDIIDTIENDLLPIATIERVQFNQGRNPGEIKANLQVHFYSRES